MSRVSHFSKTLMLSAILVTTITGTASASHYPMYFRDALRAKQMERSSLLGSGPAASRGESVACLDSFSRAVRRDNRCDLGSNTDTHKIDHASVSKVSEYPGENKVYSFKDNGYIPRPYGIAH
jgi:hypothetical protein